MATAKLLLHHSFQSTPSAWRETSDIWNIKACCGISIHSLRMEGDSVDAYVKSLLTHFNPLPPHGGRPVRRRLYPLSKGISIHSLRMEGDPHSPTHENFIFYFNPLPPHGGRLVLNTLTAGLCIISIHSLRMEGDCYSQRNFIIYRISIHSLRMEGDRTSCWR